MFLKKVVVVVTFILSLAGPAMALVGSDDDAETAKVKKKSPFWAAVRSAVFPGWGQFYTEHYLKGGLILAIEGGLIAGAAVEDHRMKENYRKSLHGGREYYDKYLEQLNRRNTCLWWLVGVRVYGILDAYVDAHLYRFDEEEVSVDIELRSGPGCQIRLVWQKNF